MREGPEKIGRVGENELPSRIYSLLSRRRRNTPKRDISQLFCCFLRLCYLKGSFCASSIAWLSVFFCYLRGEWGLGGMEQGGIKLSSPSSLPSVRTVGT